MCDLDTYIFLDNFCFSDQINSVAPRPLASSKNMFAARLAARPHALRPCARQPMGCNFNLGRSMSILPCIHAHTHVRACERARGREQIPFGASCALICAGLVGREVPGVAMRATMSAELRLLFLWAAVRGFAQRFVWALARARQEVEQRGKHREERPGRRGSKGAQVSVGESLAPTRAPRRKCIGCNRLWARGPGEPSENTRKQRRATRGATGAPCRRISPRWHGATRKFLSPDPTLPARHR